MAEFVHITPDGETRVFLPDGYMPCFLCDMEGHYEDEEFSGVIKCQECDGEGMVLDWRNPPATESGDWIKEPPINDPAMYERSLFDLMEGQS